MKIPKQIKIGGSIYRIILKDILRHEYRSMAGYENSDDCEITINIKSDIQTQETTLIHEILEAINYKNELKLNHHQIMSLEHNLYQVLKDNDLLK